LRNNPSENQERIIRSCNLTALHKRKIFQLIQQVVFLGQALQAREAILAVNNQQLGPQGHNIGLNFLLE